MSKEEVEQVAGIFRNLGADQQQASTMGSQLVKRAEQLTDEKKTSKIKEILGTSWKILSIEIWDSKNSKILDLSHLAT